MKKKTNKTDIDGKDIFTGDWVKLSDNLFQVRYGNFTYLGTQRIGFYIQGSDSMLNNQLPLTHKVKKICL